MDKLKQQLQTKQVHVIQSIRELEATLQVQYANLHRIAGGLAALDELQKMQAAETQRPTDKE
jgi:hypothetical protein